ncbi:MULTISPECIES: hypothetical protein [Staphylococcus]|uniref:Uncharacterized protein n=1 Tax=Staphylococcus hsinchuensis TaxID=3051183 RepID=A0ABZ3ED01_9STAP|nr:MULTISPECIES: hypothetical protein [unclassified Staphylococcus]
MTRGSRAFLVIISLILIISECIYGVPFLGGSFILSTGWQPLLINAFLYLVMAVYLLIDRQNTIRPMVIILFIGIIGSFLAIVPFLGMIIHWVLFFLMLFFMLVLLSAPLYVPNKHAKVIYTEHRRRK